MSDHYTIRIELDNVTEGDVTDLAQRIWDENAEALDADRGEFDITISKGNFPVDWAPQS